MKKLKILTIFLVLLSFIGCGNYISKSDAMDAAMKDLGLIQINVSDLEAALDKDSDPARYNVTFVYASADYTYRINAVTGEIISKDIQE